MASFLSEISKDLNPQQLEAVEHKEGPLLILAGAGSGKTRVLTSRIAHLVLDEGVHLNQILAMTFSNKAAREMHHRVKLMLGDSSNYRYPWISTFHSVCVRLLRRYGGMQGIDPNFGIYDAKDQLDIVKESFGNLNISDKTYNPKAVHGRISQWKNDAKSPKDVRSRVATNFDEIALSVYEQYQSLLRSAQALDFDDLLMESYKLLKNQKIIRQQLRSDWRYLLIDEFQDTNLIQYKLLREILNDEQNICVVGDDDQSIYGWRGAKIENILHFDEDFPGCKVVKLEKNYRSTGNILKAAASVISKNAIRHEKTLWTDRDDGPRLRTAILTDDRQEAAFVVGEIKKLLAAGERPSEVTVLYRINSVSRMFEEECLKKRLPYKIIGGFRFYERKEMKDVLSYLKVLMNLQDTVSFRRTINTPSRGIGKQSIAKLEEAAYGLKLSVPQYLLSDNELLLKGKAKAGLQLYKDLLTWGTEILEEGEFSLVDLVCGVLEKSKYLESLKSDQSEEARDRRANIQEFLSAIQEFEESWRLESSEVSAETQQASELQSKLFDFLERVALIADIDQLDEKTDEQVSFMSLHAAKGLEFNTCFMVAMEDGIFPSIRSFDEVDGLEEERRLCYVGITRAKENLYLTRAEARRTFGSYNYQIPSRFLKDLPPEVIENYVDEGHEDWGEARSYQKRYRTQDEFLQGPSIDYEFDQELNCFSFNRGDRIKHPSFGDGVVKKVEFLGEDECLTIDFISKGRKRILSQFVQKRS